MKLSDLLKRLEEIKAHYGDIECQLMDNGTDKDINAVTAYESFFIVPEKYTEPDAFIANIRSWPY